ncbi:CotH kinase family protein [Planctomycetota bacterium]
MFSKTLYIILCLCLLFSAIQTASAQWGGFGGRRGGMGGGMNQTTELVKYYDKDGNGWLDTEERKNARGSSSSRTSSYRRQTAIGPKLTPDDVKWYSDNEPLYDIQTLRTLFLDFEDDNWESELVAFYHTDVEVPAKLTVDGKTFDDVGIRFRGNTSYQAASTGQKRPLNLSVDLIHENQRLYGYRTLNLLNSSNDPTFLRQVLYQQIANQYFPALKANYIRLVINGESWGIYINYQQFNTDYIKGAFDTRKGGRWKVPMNMGGMGRGGGSSGSGLAYLGQSSTSYKRLYEIKSNDDPNSWAELINLCKVLNQTPTDKLEEALEPILDIDSTLRFLAVDNALINNDGYWTRASDYLIYQDKNGRFHIIPYDTSETMCEVEAMNGGGGRSVNLQPLAGAYDSGKPLLSKLLLVPSLRQRYLVYIRDIAENWLNWDIIGPFAEQYQALIAEDIKTDNRKLGTTEAFFNGLTQNSRVSSFGGFGGRGGFGGSASISIKNFVEQRSKYLLGLQQVSQVALPTEKKSI